MNRVPSKGASDPMPPALLSYDDAQAYLGGVSRWTIKSLVYNGEIRRIAIGGRTLFRRDDLDALIERKSEEGA